MFLCKDCVVPFGERSKKKLIITLPYLTDFGFKIFGGTKQYWVNKIWIQHFLEYKQILVKKTVVSKMLVRKK